MLTRGVEPRLSGLQPDTLPIGLMSESGGDPGTRTPTAGLQGPGLQDERRCHYHYIPELVELKFRATLRNASIRVQH